MTNKVKFVHNLSSLSLFLLLCVSGNFANEPNYHQEQSLSRPERYMLVLQSQQQPLALERFSQKPQQLNASPKKSIYWPMVNSAPYQPPTTQQLSSNGNNLHLSNVHHNSNQQYNTYIRQQQPTMVQLRMTQQQLEQQQSSNKYQPQSQQDLTKFSQQQHINQKYELPLTLLPTQQLVNNRQYLQPKSYQQHQQQQQVFNFAPIGRYQQQQYQMHQPQQSPQLQKQHLQFSNPQMTTKTATQQLQIYSPQPNSYYHFQQKQQQTNLNFIKQPTYTQLSSSLSPMAGNSSDLVISPLLPFYLDENDEATGWDSTQLCQTCCVDGQNPCQRCCDSRPFLSAAVLKSAVG